MTLGSAAEEASIGEIEMTAFVSSSSAADGDGDGGGDGDGRGGSLGSSGEVSGVWKPTGWSGRRRVPLLGFGSIPRESQIMLYTSVFSILVSF